jgi:hypothetical protein
LLELLLPAGMRVLSGELAAIDRLLDDRRFLGPFRSFFDPVEGRPSIPIETYLRLMFLKYRYDVGYEPGSLEASRSMRNSAFSRSSWFSRARSSADNAPPPPGGPVLSDQLPSVPAMIPK